MNDCEWVREYIGTWLDGELSPSQSEALRTHLKGCSECDLARRQLERLHRVFNDEVAAQAGRIEFLPFWRELQSRIQLKRTWYENALSRWRDFLTAPRLAWSIPAVIALVLGLVSLDSLYPRWRFGAPRNNFAAVDSIDTYGRSVALLRENETRTTVIWLYDEQEGDNETAEEPVKSGPAF